MTAVTITDPCDIWVEGVSAVLSAVGYETSIVEEFSPEHIPANAIALVALTKLPSTLIGAVNGSARPLLPVVVILHATDQLPLADFMASPITGLLLSTASRESVLDCLKSVKRNERWVDPHFAARPCPDGKNCHSWDGLSRREEEVARLAAEGLSNKHIARALNLSDGTIKTHVHNILHKLGYERRRQLSFDRPNAPSDRVH